MNKNIIALAVAAALTAPVAAQAAPTVYGKINIGIASFDDGNDGAANVDGLAIFDEASRLGVKGSSDLGGGLKAIYKMEGTVDMDGNGGFSFNRDTMFGLKGGFGTIMLGHMNTAFKNTTGKMDLFADMHGDITGLAGGDTREENMVKYENKFGKVKFAADVHFSEAASDNNPANGDESGMGMTLGVNFMAGPVEIGIGHAVCGGLCNKATTDEGDTATKIGVKWKGGPHMVNAWYQTGTDDSLTTLDGDEFMAVQYGVKMGKNIVQASYSTYETDGPQSGAEQISVAFITNFSKSTKGYISYSSVDNEANSNKDGRLDSGIGSLNPTAGKDPSSIVVGFTHKF